MKRNFSRLESRKEALLKAIQCVNKKEDDAAYK